MNLVRAHILRYVDRLLIYISTLPEHEAEALAALSGKEGAQNAALIASFICERLGHAPSSLKSASNTVRKARKALRVDPRYIQDHAQRLS